MSAPRWAWRRPFLAWLEEVERLTHVRDFGPGATFQQLRGQFEAGATPAAAKDWLDRRNQGE